MTVSAATTLYAVDRSREVVRVVEQCKVQATNYETQIQTITETARSNRDNLLTCEKMLTDEVGLQADIERQNQEAVDALAKQAALAKREAAAWQSRYNARPATCTAALAEVEKQCASLSDY